MSTIGSRATARGALQAVRGRLRVPVDAMGRATLAVVLIALLNGVVWSLITPPFQVPDETAHFAYAQHVAETGKRAGELGHPEFSSEQSNAMNAMGALGVIGRPLTHVPAAGAPDRAADAVLRQISRDAPRGDGGGPSTASSQPPLYYVLAAVPYRVFAWASLPVRLEAMRLLSALFFALSAGAASLLVGELLPQRPWAVLAGGLAVGLSPYTAFIASGVTPDALLLLTGTLTLWLVARCFRRGLTARRAVALGLVVGAGAATKLTYLAFVPPAVLAFALLLWRDRAALARVEGGVLRTLAGGVGAGLLLPLLAVVWIKATSMPLQPTGTGTPGLPAEQIKGGSLRELLSYSWQLYFPRPPFLTNLFGFWPPDATWLQGFAGRYGWLDYGAPAQVIDVMRDVVRVGLVLIVAAAVQWRRALRRDAVLVLVLALFTALLMAVIAKSGYDYKRTTGLIFEQPRYLFPVAGLFSVAVATACLGLGRRLAPALACLAIGLFCVHDLSGVLVTLARYYS